MIQIRQHRWSFGSVVLTLGNFLLSFGTVQYLYRRGAWNPNSSLGSAVELAGAIGVLLSLLVAVVAIFRERSRGYGFVALSLSLLSFFLYVR